MFFQRFDTWLIDRHYQRWTDWVTEKIGTSSYTLAALCGFVYLSTSIGLEVLYGFMGWLAQLVKALHLLVTLYLARKAYRFAKNPVPPTARTASPLRQFMPWGMARIMYLPFAIVVTVLMLTVGIVSGLQWLLHPVPMFMIMSNWGIALLYGFGGCTPKPPKPKEVYVPAGALEGAS
ncbi:MAG TPA: hypothetical protein VEB18_00580 [Candidatus Paceibacterota bacterium]|nr:hypothetical protein [Candidatus Paceibacterota bacterium]